MSVHDNVTKDGFRIEGNIEFDGDIKPIESQSHDLGSSDKRFRDIWLSDHLDGTEPRIHFGDYDFTASDVLLGRDAVALAGTALQPGAVDFFTDIYNRPQTLEQFQITDPVATGSLTVNEQSILNGVTISNTEHGFTVNGTSVSRFSTDLTVTQTTRLSGDIIHSGNITPETNGTLFVGASANRYKQVYVSERVHIGADSIDTADIGTIRDVQNGVYATAGQGALADTAYQEGDSITVNNLSMSGSLHGPETFYIDPEAIGDNTGKVVILGSLQVDGDTTTVNSTTVTVSSRSILLAEGSGDPVTSNNSGLTIDGTAAKLFYKSSPNSWYSSVPVKINNTNSGSSFEVVQTLSGSNPDDLIVLRDKDSTTKFKIDKDFHFNLSDNLYFNSTTNRMGVGTTTPAVGLHVHTSDAIMLPRGTTAQRPAATTNTQQGYIRYNTTTSQFEGFGAGNSWGSLGGVMDVDQDTYISPESSPGADDDVLRFFTGGLERARIDSSGEVGIGTTTPASKLHVYGSARIERNGASPLLQFTDQGTSSRWIGIVDGTDRFSIYANDGTTEHFSIDTTGNIRTADQAGIMTFNDTITASDTTTVFKIDGGHGAMAFRANFVMNGASGESVAKTYEVVKQFARQPIFFKVIDTGPFSTTTPDLDVSFTQGASNYELVCTVTNTHSTQDVQIVTTMWLAGSPTDLNVTEF